MIEITVENLRAGDVVHMPPLGRACFIAQTDHPVFSGLRLVVWRLDDGSISLDALSPRQEVGEVDLTARGGGDRRVRAALVDGGRGWESMP